MSLKHPIHVSVIIVSALAFGLLMRFGGNTISWDELYYMHASFFSSKDPLLLNRYVHVYILKAFQTIFRGPFDGALAMWAATIIGSIVSTFYAARKLCPQSPSFAGLISLICFGSSITFFKLYSGVVYVDFTIMLLISASLLLYLNMVEGRLTETYAFALGFLFLAACRSKETAFGLVLLYVVSLFVVENLRHKRRRIIIYAVSGALAAQLLLMILDAFFLGDFWFSIRPEVWEQLFAFNVGVERQPEFENLNYFTLVTDFRLGLFLPCFFAALGVLRQAAQPEPIGSRLIWLGGLGLMVVILSFQIQGHYITRDRYLSPVFPFIALGAAKYFSDHSPSLASTGKRLSVALIALFFFIEMLSAEVNWRLGDEFLWWNFALMPALAYALVPLLPFESNKRVRVAFFSVFCLVQAHYLVTNIRSLVSEEGKRAFQKRFAPLSEFEPQIDTESVRKIWVSPSIFRESRIFGRDKRSVRLMYELYFGRQTNFESVVYARQFGDLADEQSDLVFLSKSDLEMQFFQEHRQLIAKDYDSYASKDLDFVMLRRRAAPPPPED